MKWMLLVIWVTLLCAADGVNGEGGSIKENVVYDVSNSPYLVTQDIVIHQGAKLTINPGVTVKFDPGVGMTIRGVLKAEVSKSKEVKVRSVQKF
ncbi:hypothetical protein Pmani_006427 [Petrolisthes manimaculis]|uniref:Uncharacterized protein n=1 Tax=Petrolisthes manimaculis TaxID=1843537 RepID=A0AAE1QCW5_9EUCA|nr:hypothetical protein Pmani_006427 [Petrolisthes manimaculis]